MMLRRILSQGYTGVRFPDRVLAEGRFRFRGRFRRRPRQELPIFIVGTGRCGTTILATMLDSHPRIAITPETHWIPGVQEGLLRTRGTESMLDVLFAHPRTAECELDRDAVREALLEKRSKAPSALLEAAYETYARCRGKARWGDNTPNFGMHIDRVAAMFGPSCFVHIIRDGRDVAMSLLRMNWGPDTVEDAARYWSERIVSIRRAGRSQPFYCECLYEDLVREPENTLRRICQDIGEEYEPVMLAYQEAGSDRLRRMTQGASKARRDSVAGIAAGLDSSRLDQWKTKMSLEDQKTFAGVAGDLLGDLGYDRSS